MPIKQLPRNLDEAAEMLAKTAAAAKHVKKADTDWSQIVNPALIGSGVGALGAGAYSLLNKDRRKNITSNMLMGAGLGGSLGGLAGMAGVGAPPAPPPPPPDPNAIRPETYAGSIPNNFTQQDYMNRYAPRDEVTGEHTPGMGGFIRFMGDLITEPNRTDDVIRARTGGHGFWDVAGHVISPRNLWNEVTRLPSRVGIGDDPGRLPLLPRR